MYKLESDELTDALAFVEGRLQAIGQRRTIEEIAATSQAISLKRIADALTAFQAKLEAEEAEEKKRRGTSYDDVPGGRGD